MKFRKNAKRKGAVPEFILYLIIALLVLVIVLHIFFGSKFVLFKKSGLFEKQFELAGISAVSKGKGIGCETNGKTTYFITIDVELEPKTDDEMDVIAILNLKSKKIDGQTIKPKLIKGTPEMHFPDDKAKKIRLRFELPGEIDKLDKIDKIGYFSMSFWRSGMCIDNYFRTGENKYYNLTAKCSPYYLGSEDFIIKTTDKDSVVDENCLKINWKINSKIPPVRFTYKGATIRIRLNKIEGRGNDESNYKFYFTAETKKGNKWVVLDCKYGLGNEGLISVSNPRRKCDIKINNQNEHFDVVLDKIKLDKMNLLIKIEEHK